MQSKLTTELQGVCRVPVMCFSQPDKSLDDTKLSDYEALPHEPMHDISGHISNLFDKMPHHLEKSPTPKSIKSEQKVLQKSKQTCKSKKCKSKSPKLNAQTCYRNVVPANDMRESDKNLPSKLNVAKELEESIKLTFEGKEVKRCVDYRAPLLKVTHLMKGKLPDDFQVILDTLAEIQEILYSYDEQRSSRTVLRLYNLTFWHAVMLKIVLGTQMKSLTTRKYYGKYFHGLISHSPLQHCLMSGASMNTEDEERVFNKMKRITNTTSSKHPGHVIGNAYIRLQEEKEVSSNDETIVQNHLREISRLFDIMDKLPNSFFPFELIKTYASAWQAHLERISDFMLCGEGVLWTQDENGITFHDSPGEPEHKPEGPALHHFRSWTLESEVK